MNAARDTLALVGVLAAVLGGTPRLASAASASVSVTPQADGSVVATARGSFDSCVRCAEEDVDKRCLRTYTVNYGSITLQFGAGGALCWNSGNGGASCMNSIDRGLLHGTSAYTAIAADCTDKTSSMSTSLTLDNTPTVSISTPSGTVTGPFDIAGMTTFNITGSATFKPTLNPTKGTITLYVNSNPYPYATKSCPTENCSFSYQDLVGQPFALLPGGPYTVKLVASGGGASASAQQTFTVAPDNIPSVRITAPNETVSGPFDITGSATFKTTLGTTKGTITLYIGHNPYAYATKSCLTQSCTFSYKDLTGQLYELRHGGPYTVKLIASGGGAAASDQKSFTVDNTPSVTVATPSGTVSGPFDITGSATFKPTLSPTKGTIALYINNVYTYISKSCPTETCTFSYKDLTGQLYERYHGGPYTVKLIASGSGASASDQKSFSVDNTPSVSVIDPSGVVLSPFDITGTATFKPTLSPTKGTIALYINNAYTYVSKTCTTQTCTFSYQELSGNLYSRSPGGPYTVRLLATGGGASASDQKTFWVANCRDNDRDGFLGADPVSCPPPLGDDCNDNDATIFPGAPEQCNSKDNNCNGVAAEGACDGMCVPFASSLNPATGALVQRQVLFATRGAAMPARVSLHYNSRDIPRSALGTGWMHNYEMTLTELRDGSVIVRQGDGTSRLYYPTNSGYRAQAGDYATLTKTTDGWQLTEKSGLTQTFDRAGHLLAMTDRHGNRTTLTYTLGLLSSVVDAAGRSTTFTYNPERQLSLILDPTGNRHTFSYQGTYLASASTEDTLLGTRTWAYTYTAGGLLLSKTDPNGQTTHYTYGASNRVSSSTTPDGQVQSVSYDPATTITRLTASDGGVWSYRYDPRLGVITHTTDPLGHTTRYTYDERKQVIARLNPDGRVTRYLYDAQGNLVSLTDALGQSTTYTANAFGQLTSRTGPQGDRTVYTYDAQGNLLSSTDPSGALTRYAYDAQGHLLRRTDALGHSTFFSYDARGHLGSMTDPSGSTTQFTVDLAGNVTSQTDAQGSTTHFAYDSLNQMLQVTDPLGHATAYTYDAVGNRLSQTDALGHLTTYTYNYRGQVTAVQDALQHVTTLCYGPHGCPACGSGRDNPLTQVTDAKGQTTQYHYDRAGRLLTETTPLGTATTYTYDATGRPLTRTDANGATISYAYDTLGRLLTKTFPDGSTASFTYDANGNLLTASNPHISYTFSYDLTNRVTAVTDSRGLTIRYQYDALGNRTQMQYPDGSAVAYAYDPAGRLASLTHEGSTVTFDYDRVGRRARTTAPNGTSAAYTYDPKGQLTALTHRDTPGAVVEPLAYTYDAVGNRTTKTDHQGSSAYTYDALSRLVEATTPVPTLPQETFTYDAVGNRLQSIQNGAAAFNTGNQLLEDAQFTYQYDANGNRTRKTAKADGAVTTYTYDAENQLTQVVASTGLTVSYTYDALGRRLTKTVHHGSTTVTQYVYDGADVLLDLDATQAVVARYTHGAGIDEPLLLVQDGQMYAYHADGLGSITTLTEASGDVVQRYAYTAFGTLASPGDADVVQPYTFTGREWDTETGLYYYRARYYDPRVGQFLSQDPLGLEDGVNRYQYVSGNPISYTDPTGLETYRCQRPLGGLPGANQRTGPDIWGNPLYHQYSCTRDVNGKLICGGQGLSASWWGSPGKPTTPETDYYHADACRQTQDDNRCFEQCLIDEWRKPRPHYGIPFGTDCQEYDNDINTHCRKQCGLK